MDGQLEKSDSVQSVQSDSIVQTDSFAMPEKADDVPMDEQQEKSDNVPDKKVGFKRRSSQVIQKYFWEGQILEGQNEIGGDAGSKIWYVKYRRVIAILVPALFFQVLWWSYMISQNRFGVFTETQGAKGIPRWYMSITMVFGSMIAGATSEGGASVAFPVMTLAFGIKPAVARDFSFMIQSVGMSAAAVTILWMKVRIEKHALIYCTMGGFVGIMFGLDVIAPALTPAYSKMYFVCIWFAFAFSLYWMNRLFGRKTYFEIPYWSEGVLWRYQINDDFFICFNWKAAVLLVGGIFGGIFSAIAGSGIDICSFATLTLVFRVTEKTATPTSVVLMAVNTCVGFLWRQFRMGGVQPDSWGYLWVCMPIVVFGAPFGSVLGSHFHRLVLAAFVYVTDTTQLIGALLIVRPWTTKKTKTPTHLTITSILILLAGFILFKCMANYGEKLMMAQEEKHAQNPKNVSSSDEKNVNVHSDKTLGTLAV